MSETNVCQSYAMDFCLVIIGDVGIERCRAFCVNSSLVICHVLIGSDLLEIVKFTSNARS
jgi:hypothetical protein